MPAKLWELGDELEQIAGEIIEAEGEISPELEARLDAIQGAWAEKVERIALMVRSQEANAARAAYEAERLARMVRGHKRTADSLKGYLQREMERTGRDEVKGERIKVRLQNNSRPAIHWPGAAESLPEEFRRVIVEADTQAAYLAWKDGDPLDGWQVERGKHVRLY
jgi:hypothetical protein